LSLVVPRAMIVEPQTVDREKAESFVNRAFDLGQHRCCQEYWTDYEAEVTYNEYEVECLILELMELQ
jgi:hypothetical protein